MPYAVAPALRLAGTVDQICTRKQNEKSLHLVENVGDLTDWIRGSAKPNPTSLARRRKEQLAIFRYFEQKRLGDYARDKATAEIAIQAIHSSKKDVYMSDGPGFRILESEEEV